MIFNGLDLMKSMMIVTFVTLTVMVMMIMTMTIEDENENKDENEDENEYDDEEEDYEYDEDDEDEDLNGIPNIGVEGEYDSCGSQDSNCQHAAAEELDYIKQCGKYKKDALDQLRIKQMPTWKKKTPSQMDVAPWCYKWDWVGWISPDEGRNRAPSSRY